MYIEPKKDIVRIEQYSDTMTRLFGYEISQEERQQGLRLNGPHCKNITFQVTEDCNLKCSYCYQGHKTKNRMSFDVAKKFIDMILASDERTNKYITADKSIATIIDFIGGEPFLEVELMDQIMEYFISTTFNMHHRWATRFRISISTNGMLYFTPKVQDFVKKYNNVLSLGVTIDGNRELHDSCRLQHNGCGSYDIAMAAVKHYTNILGGSMGSKMTIAPGNISHIKSAVINMLDNGYKEINLNCVFEDVWNYEYAKELYRQLKSITDEIFYGNKEYSYDSISIFSDYIGAELDPDNNSNWCGGTGLMIAVDWKGDIFPCIRYMESSLNGEQVPYSIGNVDTGIMSNPLECSRVECMGCITRRSQSTDECFNCPIASGCAWCSGYNYQVFGTPNKRATFICPMHKSRVLANCYYWNTMFKLTGKGAVYKLNVPREWALEIIDEDEYNMLLKMSEERIANGCRIINNTRAY